MPFPSYDTQEAVPETQRNDYRQGKDGRYYAVLEETHPLVVKKKELATNIATNKDKVLQHGQRAVSIADFTLLTNIKGLNIPEDKIVERLQKYPDLEKKEQDAVRATSYENAAKFLKYPNVEAFKNTLSLAGVEITWKEEAVANSTDKVQVPYVGEKRLSDHINETPTIKVYEPFFKVQPQQAKAPATEAGAGARPNSTGTGTANGGAGGSTTGNVMANQPGGGGDTSTVPGQQQQQQQYVFTRPGDIAWGE